MWCCHCRQEQPVRAQHGEPLPCAQSPSQDDGPASGWVVVASRQAGRWVSLQVGCWAVIWSRVAVACKLRSWSLPRQCERFVRQGGLLSLRRPSLGGPAVMLDGGRRSDACRLQGTRRCLLDLPGLAAGELVVYMRAMQQAVLRCQPACVLIDGR